jgi:hypothetical protein
MLLCLVVAATWPSCWRFWYRAGTGHALLTDRANLLDTSGEKAGARPGDALIEAMRRAEKAERVADAERQGLKCAALMTAGCHAALVALTLITMGLLTSASKDTKGVLWAAFVAAWLVGWICLSIGVGYFGSAPPLATALPSCLLIYLVVLALLALAFAIGRALQRRGQ